MRFARTRTVAKYRPTTALLEMLETRSLLSTYTVTTTADSGAGSLRAAITSVNSGFGGDTIDFSIAGSGVQIIAPTSPLPIINQTVTINGYSQPLATANTNGPGLADNANILIEIDGTNAFVSFDLGTIKIGSGAGGSVVRGLSLVNSRTNGLAILPSSATNIIAGNFIGVLPDGVTRGANGGGGIELDGSLNIIGGTNPADRNIVSGNTQGQIDLGENGSATTSNTIEGNFVGTDKTGAAAVASNGDSDGIAFNNNLDNDFNIVGGTTAAARNIISGNGFNGVDISNDIDNVGVNQNVVEGNFIGTDVTGTVALGNGGAGIRISNDLNQVGAAGAGNVISANGTDGIEIDHDHTNVYDNKIGTDVTGLLPLGNADFGIAIGGSNNTIGQIGVAPNTIAFNGASDARGAGISISGGTDNKISGNFIFSNTTNNTSPYFGTGQGIDLGADGFTPNDANDVDTGANNLQNFPLITSGVVASGHTTIVGTLNSTPNTTFAIEYFSNPTVTPTSELQGKTYLGTLSVTTDGSGNASINDTLMVTPPNGEGSFSATATDPAGNTSEFGPNFQPSVIFLNSNSNPANGGTSITFTANVSVSPNATPTGTMNFYDGSTLVDANVPVDGTTHSATYTTSALIPGTHPISAVYSGDTLIATGTSPTVNQVINGTPTTSTLVALPTSSFFNDSVTFTGLVAPNLGNSIPTGVVSFFVDNGFVITGSLDNTGHTTFTTTTLAVGSHTVHFSYPGASGFQASTSADVTFVVSAAGASVTTVVPSETTGIIGDNVTLTATISDADMSPGTNTLGTVTFMDGGTTLGTSNLDSNKMANLSTTGLHFGVNNITAVFSGNDEYLPSTSANVTVTLATPTNTTLMASETSGVVGDNVTFTATVADNFGSADQISSSQLVVGTPGLTGTVTFLDGSTVLGTGTISAGVATFSTTSLAAGAHVVTASYGGDSADAASVSSGVTVTLAGAGLQNADVGVDSITSSPNPVISGNNITYTIVVSNSGAAVATNVVFTADIPAGTTFVSARAPNGDVITAPAVGGTGTITITRASAPDESTETYTIVLATDPVALDGTVIHLLGSISSNNPDNDPDNQSTGVDTTISNPQQADDYWIRQLYHDLLHRTAAHFELVDWHVLIGQLHLTHPQIAYGFESSHENRMNEIRAAYSTYLHRVPSDADVETDYRLLLNGETESQLVTSILTSHEYLAVHNTSNNALITSMFTDVLGRPALSSDLTFYNNLIALQGITALAQAITNAHEFGLDFFANSFTHFLRRNGSLSDLTTYAQNLVNSNGDIAHTESNILFSDEFYNLAQVRKGT